MRSSPRFLLCAFLALLPLPAAATMVDKGVVMRLEGLYDASSVAVSEYKGQRVLWMDGAPVLKDSERGGIYFSGQSGQSWTRPRLAFAKEGYLLRRPSIVKHPRLNQYLMFYAMRPTQPVEERRRDPETGEIITVTQPPIPMETIGVASASACANSTDGSGLCWHDLSAERPLIGAENGFNQDGGGSPNALLSGTQVHLYYRTNAPSAQLMRTIVDLRDWSRVETKPLTIQVSHPITKKWRLLEPHEQIGIDNPSVAPLGTKGYLMMASDGSPYVIGRWKSEDGLNFYRDPERTARFYNEGASFGATTFETIGKDEFLVYYALGDGAGPCSEARRRAANNRPCLRMIEARQIKEE